MFWCRCSTVTKSTPWSACGWVKHTKCRFLPLMISRISGRIGCDEGCASTRARPPEGKVMTIVSPSPDS